MKKNSTTKQPLDDSKNTKPVLRDSSYGDYVAVDMVDERGLIVSTPFYIKEGQTIEAHWPKPSNEQPKNPVHYDDFNDVFQFMMQDGNILSKWANSGLNSVFEIMDKKDLETWDFHKARKIKVVESKPDSKEGLLEICGSVVPWSEIEKAWKQYSYQSTPDSKEGLHTQGEWKTNFDGSVIFSKYSDGTTIIVARLDKEMEAVKANAELIVKAVNEYPILKEARNQLCQLVKDMTDERKALLDENEKLKKYLNKILKSPSVSIAKNIETIKNEINSLLQ